MKSRYLERAKELLLDDSDHILPYACLELRFCLESITYEKLNTYSSRIPPMVYEKWQPPQVLKALLRFEPFADQDYKLSFCKEPTLGKPDGNWKHLGSHKTFKIKWLRKTYNKLGSYLHIPTLSSQAKNENIKTNKTIRAFLEETVGTLESIVKSNLDCNFARTISFDCAICNTTIVANVEGVKEIKTTQCLNSNCCAEYYSSEENGEIYFKLQSLDFKCLNCDNINAMELSKIEINTQFNCLSCNSKHTIISKNWQYGLNKDEQSEEKS